MEKKTNSHGDCLYYLVQCTRRQPKELIKSCQHMPPSEGYLKAKTLLKNHFGNEQKISAAYMDKVLSWKLVKSEDTKFFSRLLSFP